MKTKYVLTAALLALLSACNGDDDDDDDDEASTTRMVVFGDNYSDMGTYAVGAVAEAGGGKFTINGDGERLWVQTVASALGVSEGVCAAQTGLQGDASLGYSVPVENHDECFNYAQGGARVTEPIGFRNAALGDPLGALTVPVNQQIDHFLSVHGSFQPDDTVFVYAGINDILWNLDSIANDELTEDAAYAAVEAAAAELGEEINTIMANGAQKVVVFGLPDVSLTPELWLSGIKAQEVANVMVRRFNNVLYNGTVSKLNEVLWISLFYESQAQFEDPASYGLTNVEQVACNLDPEVNPLESVLICTDATLQPDVDPGSYLWAGTLHMTPYGQSLMASQVIDRLMDRGWAAELSAE